MKTIQIKITTSRETIDALIAVNPDQTLTKIINELIEEEIANKQLNK